MAGQAQRIADLEWQVAELQERFEVTRIGLEHVFAAGAEMRRGAASREDLAYARGRESVLGGSGHATWPPQAPLPDAAFDPEAARKFGEARRANLDRSHQPAYRGGHRGRPRHLRAVDGGASSPRNPAATR